MTRILWNPDEHFVFAEITSIIMFGLHIFLPSSDFFYNFSIMGPGTR